MQNPQTWRAGRLLFVWPLTFDLSGMGVPTRTSRGPASIALGLIGVHKHPHHVKVAIFGAETSRQVGRNPGCSVIHFICISGLWSSTFCQTCPISAEQTLPRAVGIAWHTWHSHLLVHPRKVGKKTSTELRELLFACLSDYAPASIDGLLLKM